MVSDSLRLLDRIRALRSAEALASKLVVAHGANASSGAGDGRCEMAPLFLFPLNPPNRVDGIIASLKAAAKQRLSHEGVSFAGPFV